MYKVLLIDDEPIIRKGLKNTIPWDTYGCSVCGEAADGIEGLEKIKELKPEIIITDIRMPGMNGLDMIENIHEVVPGAKIIILTGYRDFEYAKRAIRVGAFDFLLKPSDLEAMGKTIRRAVEALDFAKRRQQVLDDMKRLVAQNMPVIREKALYDIMQGLIVEPRELEERTRQFDLCMERFTVALVEVDRMPNGEDEQSGYSRQAYQYGIMNTFEEMLKSDFSVISVGITQNQTAFIIQPQDGASEEYLERLEDQCSALQQMILDSFGVGISIALSTEGKGLAQLHEMYNEVKRAIAYKSYLGNNAIILYSDLGSFYRGQDNTQIEGMRKLLFDAIDTGSKNLVEERIVTFLSMLEAQEGKDEAGRKECIADTIRALAARSKEARLSLKQYLPGPQDPIEIWEKAMVDASLQVAESIHQYNAKGFRLIMQKSIEYLHDNYHKQILLKDVADHVYVSPYYVSRMFKKETGKTFTEYLNEIRINKAEELLKDPRFKTYEVAEMVGIPDPHYFSRLFKKIKGIPPTAYRDSGTQ
jgi:two-component system response regulator YesN